MHFRETENQAQLHQFAAREDGYEFRIIVTDRQPSDSKVLIMHKGPGTGSDLFAEIKDQTRNDDAQVLDSQPNILLMGRITRNHDTNSLLIVNSWHHTILQAQLFDHNGQGDHIHMITMLGLPFPEGLT